MFVVLRNYNQLVERENLKRAHMEPQPTGVAKAFVMLCPNTSMVGLHDMVASYVGMLRQNATVITKTAWIAVVPLLWLVRLLWTVSPLAGSLLAMLSIGSILIAEQCAQYQAQENNNALSSDRVPRQYMGHPHALKVFATQAALPANPSPSPAATRSNGLNPNDPLISTVREGVMKLEMVLYGNELTAEALPVEVLPLRVQKLCEDLAVPFNKSASAADMVQALRKVSTAVGV